uniref:UPAR/Ly6 domain-containing protein n=1 Tax=Panagrolaimus sp. PS1159 TaxID=55785 RepID=A0AC35FRI5_9BILA
MHSIVIIFACLIGYISALKCYQGSANTSYALTGVATDCYEPNAITCIKQYDSYSKFASRSCSTSNCVLNGQVVKDSVCVNVSAYQQNCCCYTDGCNSAPPSTVLTFSLAAVISVSALAFFLKI